MNVTQIADMLASIAWPATILILCAVFIKPLYQALNTLSARLDTARIKIGEFEWTNTELDNIIIEREILKSAILMAVSDEDFSAAEWRFVQGKAAGMVARLSVLTASGKQRVLRESINMAAADNVIRSKEYLALKFRASEFGVSEGELDRLILASCLQFNVAPPPELEQIYQTELDRLAGKR